MSISLKESIIDFKGKKLAEEYQSNNLSSISEEFSGFLNKLLEKEVYQQSGNYVIVTQKLISSLVKKLEGKKVLEVMSGTGLLAWHLKENGIDIVATDSGDWNLKEIEPGFVKKIDAVNAIEKYSSAEIVLMCWPYMDNNAFQVLKTLKPHQLLICCGEVKGCTADEDFWNNYDYTTINEIDYQSFFGIKDNFYIGKMKNEKL